MEHRISMDTTQVLRTSCIVMATLYKALHMGRMEICRYLLPQQNEGVANSGWPHNGLADLPLGSKARQAHEAGPDPSHKTKNIVIKKRKGDLIEIGSKELGFAT